MKNASTVPAKTFTVSHGNDRYDYKYKKSGIITKTYTRTYRFFYYISGTTTTTSSAATDLTALKTVAATLAANSYYNAADVNAVLNLSKDATVLSNAKTTLAAEKKKEK